MAGVFSLATAMNSQGRVATPGSSLRLVAEVPKDANVYGRARPSILRLVHSPSTSEVASARALDPVRIAELAAERELAERAKAGDRRALAELLRKYGPILYRSVLLPRLGSEAMAQDALADTYVRVVEKFVHFEWRGCGVYPWLRVVAMRIALDMLRSRKRERLFEPDDLVRAIDMAERDLDDGLDVRLCEERDLEASKAKLDSGLAAINSRYSLAIRLRVLEEKSREEVAATLGVTVSTLDVVLHRALKALKKALGGDAVEEEVSP